MKKIYVISALAAVYLFWGGTYLGMKVAIETFPPFLMAGVRFTSAGAVLYIISRLTGAGKPSRLHWRNTGIVGTLLLLSGNGVVCWAEQLVPSNIAALMLATVPLWIIIIDWVSSKDNRPNLGVSAGVLLGLVGIGILVIKPGGAAGSISLVGILALLAAAFSWSYGSMYSKKAEMPASALLSTAMQMLVGGVLLLILSMFMGEWKHFDISGISSRSMLGLGYLIVFGSILGYNAYIWLLKNAEPALVSTYAYVNPVVAVILGWAVLGERLASNSLAAAVIIIAAVIMITLFRNKNIPAVEKAEEVQ